MLLNGSLRRARRAWAGAGALLLLALPGATGPMGRADATSGEALFGQGKFASARDAYTRALKQTPGDPAAHQGLILTLMRLDEWQKALLEAQTTVRLAPADADAHGLLALALMRAGQPDGAERESARALELSPQNYWGLVAQGRLFLWNGQKTLARDTLRRAAALRPQTPDAWFYLTDSFEDEVTDELLHDIDAYAALKPQGHPHDIAMEGLPALRAYMNHFIADAPYHADAPVSEAQLKTADAGDGPPVVFSAPIERGGNYVVLPVLVNDQKMRLMFDTGGGFSIAFNKKSADKLNLKPLGRSFVRGVSGKEASTQAKADSMTVNGQTFKAIPIDILTGEAGAEDGVFGVSNFDHYAVTIDFTAQKLLLARGKNARAPEPLPGDRAVTLPFHELDGDVFVPIAVEGRECWALVDSGADAEVILSIDVARGVAARRKRDTYAEQTVRERLGLGNTIQKQTMLIFRDVVETRVGDAQLTFGGKPFTQRVQPAFGADLVDKQVSPSAMFEVGGILGINFLRKASRVTFDYPHHLLTLEYGRD